MLEYTSNRELKSSHNLYSMSSVTELTAAVIVSIAHEKFSVEEARAPNF